MEKIYSFDQIVDKGIEELGKLISDTIRSGLKALELRVWVDSEPAILKAQSEEENERLKAQCKAERQALKDAHKKHLAELNQQLAVLENLVKRKAYEASSVINMMEGHNKLEDIGKTGSELCLPKPEISECPPHNSQLLR